MEKHNLLSKTIKHIHDSIHGYIPLSTFAVKIIDNEYFQRLRKLKQLGCCDIVFPNAVHTRFEHSIGTYYLAGKILNRIVLDTKKEELNKYMNEIPELANYFIGAYGSVENAKFDSYVIELIKIAALCHDIGHGPFSHIFDNFLNRYEFREEFDHEYRSGNIVEKIITDDPLLFDVVSKNEIQFIKNIINPIDSIHKGFVYQIVSNSFNNLDVDKYDYLIRDTKMIYGVSNIKFERLIDFVKVFDNNIIYSEQSYSDICELFHIRKKLHEEIYCHKSVISTQEIIVELLMEINKIINIVDKMNDLPFFLKLTDSMVLDFSDFIKLTAGENTYVEIHRLTNLLNTHKLYPFITKKIVSKDIDFRENLLKYCDNDSTMKKYYDNIIVYKNKIGFVSGNKKNPLDNIYVYKSKDLNYGEFAPRKIGKYNDSIIIPMVYQEYLIMVFYRIKDKIAIKYISEHINNVGLN